MAAEDRLNSDASLPDSCTIEQANPVDVPVQMWNRSASTVWVLPRIHTSR